MKEIISPKELKTRYPLSKDDEAFISSCRSEVQNILNGDDKRILLIVGPCSIHDEKSALEFAKKLKILSSDVKNTFFLLMRCYVEKPRTQGGWKGFAFDPHLDNSHDIEAGITRCRSLFRELTRLKVPIATEFLDHATTLYLDDLVSWGCIGARTVASQTHRQLASHLPLPIGFKNTTEGNIEVAIDAMISSSHPHTFIGVNPEGKASLIHSKGNNDAHIVLRGGAISPNYDKTSLQECLRLFDKKGYPPKILIDCSHDNSKRVHEKQIDVFNTCIDHILEGTSFIKGLLLESHLFSGKQSLTSPLKYGVSITDSCLDFETTKDLIYNAEAKCKKELVAISS